MNWRVGVGWWGILMGGMRVLRFARTIAYFQEIKMRHLLLPYVLVHLNILTMSLMAR